MLPTFARVHSVSGREGAGGALISRAWAPLKEAEKYPRRPVRLFTPIDNSLFIASL